jgi:hypothetical protein
MIQTEFNEQISAAVMLRACWSILLLPVSYLGRQIKIPCPRILVILIINFDIITRKSRQIHSDFFSTILLLINFFTGPIFLLFGSEQSNTSGC